MPFKRAESRKIKKFYVINFFSILTDSKPKKNTLEKKWHYVPQNPRGGGASSFWYVPQKNATFFFDVAPY